MEVILLEKVVNLGQLGDIVRVKDGHARNFLIPQGKARRATEKNREEFAVRRSELERLAQEQLKSAQERAQILFGKIVVVKQKAGVDGRLFGSVTNQDIAEALTLDHFESHKSQIRLPNGHLKNVGDHQVNVVLHTDVVVEITVSVVPE
ncbi:MAG: 50S ribosomal protein L9 [Ferrovum sp.]|jgi:large subunit ribosomal protein L9|nr:50S ribosomal protein L9 [Ferrovum sp.]